MLAELEDDRWIDPDDSGNGFRSRMRDAPAVGHESAMMEPVDEPAGDSKAFLQGQEEVEAADGVAPVDVAEAGERIQVCELAGLGLDGGLCLGLTTRRVASERDHCVCFGDVIFRGMKSELGHFVAHPARAFFKRQNKGTAVRIRQAPEPFH